MCQSLDDRALASPAPAYAASAYTLSFADSLFLRVFPTHGWQLRSPVLHTTYPRRSNPERPHQMHTLQMRIWWRRGESNPRVASVVAMLQRILCPLLVAGWAGPDSRRHSCGQTIFKVLSWAHASKQDCAVNQSVRTFGAHQNNPRPRNWTNAKLSMSTESSCRTDTVQSP